MYSQTWNLKIPNYKSSTNDIFPSIEPVRSTLDSREDLKEFTLQGNTYLGHLICHFTRLKSDNVLCQVPFLKFHNIVHFLRWSLLYLTDILSKLCKESLSVGLIDYVII